MRGTAVDHSTPGDAVVWYGDDGSIDAHAHARRDRPGPESFDQGHGYVCFNSGRSYRGLCQ